MTRYLMGIDAGATKTKGTLFHEDGEEIQSVVSGPGNIIVEEEAALRHVTQVIQALLPIEEEVALLALGMAGVETAGKIPYVEETLRARFPMIQEIRVMNDGALGMAAALQGGDGIFVIAGTGSVVLGKYRERVERVGGLGHLLGDQGGAYWIGKKAFEKLAEDYNTGIFTEFSKALLRKEGIPENGVLDLIRKFYGLSKEEVAQYATFVSEMQMEGDQEARGILVRAGEELARQIQLMKNRFPKGAFGYVAISGSVLTRNETVKHACFQNLPDLVLLDEPHTPEKAVYYEYKNKHEKLFHF